MTMEINGGRGGSYDVPEQILSDAIDRSKSHTEIVRVDYTEALYDLAIEESEGYAEENNGDIDVWGQDVDGVEWRLRLVVAS